VFGLGPATRIYLAAGSTDMRKGFPARNHGGKKSLTAAARMLDPKLSDRNAVYVPVFRRAVESVEGNVGTRMNSVIDDFDSMHVD
jgi:hypothetical protein